METRRLKRRVTRLGKSLSGRKAGILFEGKEIDCDDVRIRRALIYNLNISNEFIVQTPTSSTESKEIKKLTKKHKKPMRSRKNKKNTLAEDEAVKNEINRLNNEFDEVDDYELLVEDAPRDFYDIKRKRRHTYAVPLQEIQSTQKTHSPLGHTSPYTFQTTQQTTSLLDYSSPQLQSTQKTQSSLGHPSYQLQSTQTTQSSLHTSPYILQPTQQTTSLLEHTSPQLQTTQKTTSILDHTTPHLQSTQQTPSFLDHTSPPTQQTTSLLEHTSPQLQTTQETLQESDEDQVLTWDDFSKFQCYRKLGEGDYGEVYGVACDGAELALKVIPINEHNSAENVSTEIFITRQLSALRDEGYSFVTSRFIRLIRAAVVKGAYPENLLTAWDKYRQEKGEAIALNHRPECNMNNTYGLLLMENGGTDLEAYLAEENVDPSQCFSIFYQVALSIAIAEKRCEFEHRDLHIGNILIFKIEEKGRNTAKKCSDDGIRFIYNDEEIYIRSYGVHASIIDFTNSRATDTSRNNIARFNNLSDDIFTGSGDYQFDIYRMMKAENNDTWGTFLPKTNLFWLHYLSRKLFDLPDVFKITKRRKDLLKFFDQLLTFNSAADFIEDKNFRKKFAPYRF